MSRFGSEILKTIFVLMFIGGTVIYVSTKATNGNAHSALQTTEKKTTSTSYWVGEKADSVRKGWQRIGVENQVVAFQDKARPVAQKLASAVAPKAIPGVEIIKKGERRMSLPALLLMFVFGGILFFMGRSGPSSMLGGRH